MLSIDDNISDFDIHKTLKNIFGNSHHSKTISSIANAALGVVNGASLIIHRIGRGLADALNLSDKHAVKQVDRLLSNTNLDVWASFEQWVPFLIGNRKEVKITMDWTEFAKDKHATICLNLITSHGRATPLIWMTVSKNSLKNNRNSYEDKVLVRLKELVPNDVDVTIIADRGFCDIRLMDFIRNDLCFDYIIRIRGNIKVSTQQGEIKNAIDWVGKSGRTKTLRNARITHERYEVNTIACTHASDMKEAWCIVSSKEELSGSGIIKWYTKRWGCEPQFRDTKDIYFGMGLSKTHIGRCDRRDRILLLNAIATVILTFIGAAGERIGLDRYLKVNTVKQRTLSLFNQGKILYNRIPKMAAETLDKLLKALVEIIEENSNINTILGVV